MPYEKLLELVESKQLDITTVSLAEVTADFIKYIENLGNKIDSGTLSDFITVAAKLLLIKSKALLPDLPLSEEEESDIKNLETRLVLYKQFRVAGIEIKKLWNNESVMFSRNYFQSCKNTFCPPRNLAALDLLSALASLAIELEQFLPDKQEVKTNIISLEQKMEELINRFNQNPQQNLQELVTSKPRAEVIVIFLAILHLLKRQIINVNQNQWINLA